MSLEFRIESDAIGEVQVPVEAAWMAQTQCSLQQLVMPLSSALADHQCAAAMANKANGHVDKTGTIDACWDDVNCAGTSHYSFTNGFGKQQTNTGKWLPDFK